MFKTVKVHKWAKEIKAWADGAVIQYRSIDPDYMDRQWYDCRHGVTLYWDAPYCEFRVKPEVKPDVVGYCLLQVPQYGKGETYNRRITEYTTEQSRHDNVKCTFDGETGKLKSVELIK